MNNIQLKIKDSQDVFSRKFQRTVMDTLYEYAPNKECFTKFIDEDGFYTYSFKQADGRSLKSDCIFNVPSELVEKLQCTRKQKTPEEETVESYKWLRRQVQSGRINKRCIKSTISEYKRRTHYIAIYNGEKIKWAEQYAKGTQRYNKKQIARIKDSCNYFSTLYTTPFFATFTFDRKLFNKNLYGTWEIGSKVLTRFMHNVSRNIGLDYVRVSEAHKSGHCHYHAIIFTNENKEKYWERKKKNGDKYVLKGRLRDEFERNWTINIQQLIKLDKRKELLNMEYLKEVLEKGETEVKLGFFDLRLITEKEYIQNYITKYISKEKTQNIEEFAEGIPTSKIKDGMKSFYTFFMPIITKTRSVAISNPKAISNYIEQEKEKYLIKKEMKDISEEDIIKEVERRREEKEKVKKTKSKYLPGYEDFKRRDESLAYLKELCTNSTIPCMKGVYFTNFKPSLKEGENRIEVLNRDYGNNEDNIISHCTPMNCGSCIITQFLRFAMGMKNTWFDKGNAQENMNKKINNAKTRLKMAEMALQKDEVYKTKEAKLPLGTDIGEWILNPAFEKRPKEILPCRNGKFFTTDGKEAIRHNRTYDKDGFTYYYAEYWAIGDIKDPTDKEVWEELKRKEQERYSDDEKSIRVIEDCKYDLRLLPIMNDFDSEDPTNTNGNFDKTQCDPWVANKYRFHRMNENTKEKIFVKVNTGVKGLGTIEMEVTADVLDHLIETNQIKATKLKS